ncbi:Uncharacterized protein YneR [Oceanobacillus limi]|uniref:Uncharacterized protein YneR n=1 Tax=Oceanobacillus limi TaxID=930131 RepID=A0A1I0C7P0_9BACI|nr:hypothetical protein [Oceanobacillus limi]SET15477.1 Uncharacterized protein YneR [Oceanobacillus limi]
MGLHVKEEAANWFIEEMDLEQGDFVQFFLKIYGGIPTIYPNYFLGMSYGKHGDIHVKDEVEGITFYLNEEDSWILEEYDLEVVKFEEEEVEFKFNER